MQARLYPAQQVGYRAANDPLFGSYFREILGSIALRNTCNPPFQNDDAKTALRGDVHPRAEKQRGVLANCHDIIRH